MHAARRVPKTIRPEAITGDGAFVWVVNPDHDSVSRIATTTDTVSEFPLPASGIPPQHHAPSGLSLSEDGSEVWVACHDSDRVYVLRGADAVRFWLQNPSLDEGWALQLTTPARQETRFRASEEEIQQYAPVLTLTYTLPSTTSPPPPEVSGAGSGAPLMVDQAAGGGLTLSFQDLGGAVGTYNIYEGTLGGGYNHAPKACAAAVTAAGGRLQATLTPAAGNTYYLVTAADLCQEGTSGSDSSGTPQPSANLTCSP